jgi:hypothetical protein
MHPRLLRYFWLPLPGLAMVVPSLPAAPPIVEFRKDPTAAERVGDLLLDAKGNRVMAESIRSAAYLLVFRGSERDSGTRDFAQRLAQKYHASFEAERYEIVVLESAGSREDLLRLLRTVDAHWYGVDPAAPAAPALGALFPPDAPASAPALLLLDWKGATLAVTDPKGPFAAAGDVLKELDKRLAEESLKPSERREEERKLRQAERAALAQEMKSNPTAATDDKIRALYPVEGMLKVKGVPHAMINKKVVSVGDHLDNGAKVVAFQGANVVVELAGRRITLQPAPIPGAQGR